VNLGAIGDGVEPPNLNLRSEICLRLDSTKIPEVSRGRDGQDKMEWLISGVE
jgi:hypothetical protein